MTTQTIAERVAAGAAFLDEREPGWDKRIDLDKLSIGSGCNCVLGQLYQGFGLGLVATGLVDTIDQDVDLGFYWDDEGTVREEVQDLTAAWQRLIAARRAGDPR